MCFSKPQAPPLTPDEIATQAEAQQARDDAKAKLAADLAREKAATTQDAIARYSGNYGIRSLIGGDKGGMGFGLRSLI
jgi:methylase of polypeptide subunit release factors